MSNLQLVIALCSYADIIFIEIIKPTPVQKVVIPRLLAKENIVMAASTGSGKTLAYAVPAIQSMQNEEMSGYQRVPKRPRCLVLVPTRELARQVLDSVKLLGHYSRVSSTAVIGGEDYAKQKKSVSRNSTNEISKSIVFSYCCLLENFPQIIIVGSTRRCSGRFTWPIIAAPRTRECILLAC